MTYPFRRTCKEVTALVVAREDRDLSLADRLALRMHMAMCDACPKFEHQMLTMRKGLRAWRNDNGSDHAAKHEYPRPKEKLGKFLKYPHNGAVLPKIRCTGLR